MVVNDNAVCLNARVARTFFASKLAPTVDRVCQQMMELLSGQLSGFRQYTDFVYTRNPVGASRLAMDVNDDAGSLTPRGVLKSIASKLAPVDPGTPEGCPPIKPAPPPRQ